MAIFRDVVEALEHSKGILKTAEELGPTKSSLKSILGQFEHEGGKIVGYHGTGSLGSLEEINPALHTSGRTPIPGFYMGHTPKVAEGYGASVHRMALDLDPRRTIHGYAPAPQELIDNFAGSLSTEGYYWHPAGKPVFKAADTRANFLGRLGENPTVSEVIGQYDSVRSNMFQTVGEAEDSLNGVKRKLHSGEIMKRSGYDAIAFHDFGDTGLPTLGLFDPHDIAGTGRINIGRSIEKGATSLAPVGDPAPGHVRLYRGENDVRNAELASRGIPEERHMGGRFYTAKQAEAENYSQMGVGGGTPRPPEGYPGAHVKYVDLPEDTAKNFFYEGGNEYVLPDYWMARSRVLGEGAPEFDSDAPRIKLGNRYSSTPEGLFEPVDAPPEAVSSRQVRTANRHSTARNGLPTHTKAQATINALRRQMGYTEFD